MHIKNIMFISIAIVVMSSMMFGQQYHLLQAIVTAGSEKGSSASYDLMGLIDQSATGQGSSANYIQYTGFGYQVNGLQDYFISTYAVADGWNMISLPLTVADYQKTVLFPTSTSAAFAYIGAYQPKDTLENGRGYWLKFSGAQNVGVTGVAVTSFSIPVEDKWNMIGSIEASVPKDSIDEIPDGIVISQYFGYDGGYYAATTIDAGEAYWVKTNGGGKLVLNAGSSPPGMNQKEVFLTQLDQLNVLTVEPQKTILSKNKPMQKLYFGTWNEKVIPLDRYEMPPMPPRGVLDVRFVSNRFVEIVNENTAEPQEFPLTIQSNGEPLTLSWNIKEQAGLKYVLVERDGKTITAQHRLRTNGSVNFDAKQSKQYSLRVERIPVEYALYQNYPNPFNPSTTIRFDLPEPASVTLKVINVLGQEVEAPLNNQDIDEGQHSIEFNAGELASGTYFYQIIAHGLMTGKQYQRVQKMVLVR
ncbi:MAG: T9SS type A sorting domain-containing protein [Ignavibacteriae bacterium]|nr:T9SS type A sorting domain-containing protein [Ignavibacteriota bacterium]